LTDFGLGPREWSPRWGKGTVDDVRREIVKWMESKDLYHDVHVYTQEEWQKRGEKFGNTGILTITAEGPFYQVMNYPESKADVRLIDEFNAFMDKLGFWTEQGYAWTWHLYPKESGPTMGEGETGKPLLTVLGIIATTRPRTVFRQADRYFSLQDLAGQVRRDIKKSADAKEALEAPIYSFEKDENEDFIIYRKEEGKQKVTFVEARSKVRTDPWG
jgi:hypothetical protein